MLEGDLLSRRVSQAVPSALAGLTALSAVRLPSMNNSVNGYALALVVNTV